MAFSPDVATISLTAEGFHQFTSGLTGLFREIQYLGVEIVLFLIYLLGLLYVFTTLVRYHFRPLDELHANPSIKSGSRKLDRTHKVQQEALQIILTNPEVMARIFKKKPNWMPKWLWRIVVGLVIVK